MPKGEQAVRQILHGCVLVRVGNRPEPELVKTSNRGNQQTGQQERQHSSCPQRSELEQERTPIQPSPLRDQQIEGGEAQEADSWLFHEEGQAEQNSTPEQRRSPLRGDRLTKQKNSAYCREDNELGSVSRKAQHRWTCRQQGETCSSYYTRELAQQILPQQVENENRSEVDQQ